ncbi:unnamed protein product [Cladocopium goreaui]|uniref:Uncharacterized protein n=1 Tax=Cladocopium goreaui TaxID=2562237 RepID=A0A9P1GEX7_9DINO|nr:unnamed protein product [Cladocopium goreaui]
MANILYRHRKDMLPPDDPKDKLAEVLEDVMTRRQLEKPRKEDGVLITEETAEYHQHGHLWLAQQHGEWHNFRLKARFLETMQGPENEPMFCSISQARSVLLAWRWSRMVQDGPRFQADSVRRQKAEQFG